ncbi:hypothetical protein GWI33_006103 [Rhynchophorus ferrugineus]|uniref:Uncharacterized protein n=1 Tax=Rhynchophorus ferrugineus TaxID=354439 RepID=A0A834IJK7_RHYFE|nr:hypothetical protein GWI33_006103 [Rhynchophorus ferrugineus]
MSGKYIGLQTRIKDINRYSEFIPYLAHSLNLVAKYAAKCCTKTLISSDFVENLSNTLITEVILEKTSIIVGAYADVLKNRLDDELVQLAEMLKTDVATIIDCEKPETL